MDAKLRVEQRSPELAFRSMDFCVPENLIFPALSNANFVLLSFSSYRSINIWQKCGEKTINVVH